MQEFLEQIVSSLTFAVVGLLTTICATSLHRALLRNQEARPLSEDYILTRRLGLILRVFIFSFLLLSLVSLLLSATTLFGL